MGRATLINSHKEHGAAWYRVLYISLGKQLRLEFIVMCSCSTLDVAAYLH